MNIKVNFDNIKVKETKKDFTVKILMLKGEKGEQGDLNSSHIVDNLTSNDSSKVLSAKQGKVLKDLVDENTTKINKKPYYFNTVAEMKAGNLSAGDMVITKGYYSANDGGNAEYLIRTKTNSDVEDNASIHFIGNTLVAELIIDNNIINIKQIGGKSYSDNNNTAYDNKNILISFINICEKLSKKLCLFIPSGKWAFSPTQMNSEKGFTIKGVESFYYSYNSSTIIVPFTDNQNFVWKIGGNEDFSISGRPSHNISINNLVFSGLYSDSSTSWYHIEKGLLCLDYCLYSFFDKLMFEKFDGGGLYIRSCWEDYFGILNFRTKTNPEYPCILFDSVGAFIPGANISALEFDKLMFEGVVGTYILSKNNSSLTHCHFNNINIECTYGTTYQEQLTDMTVNEDTSNYEQLVMFDGRGEYLTFGNINYYNQYDKKLSLNNKTYYFAGIFRNIQKELTNATIFPQYISVSNLMFHVMQTSHAKIFISKNSNAGESNLQIGNLNIETSAPIDFLEYSYGNLIQISNVYNSKLNINNDNIIPFYKIAYMTNNRGCLISDKNATNTFKIVYKKPSIGMNNQTMYVNDASIIWNYKNTETKNVSVNLKADENVEYRLIIRGTLNGTSKDYTISGTGTGNYEIKNVECSFDENTTIYFVESLSLPNCYLDYLRIF